MLMLATALGLAGCHAPDLATFNTSRLAQTQAGAWENGQLRIHTLVDSDDKRKLFQSLVQQQELVSELTGLQFSGTERPIDVYLFRDLPTMQEFTRQSAPTLANRRAFFVSTPDALRIYACFSPRLAVDLRHEVTHGYLHSVAEDIPLWIDEGLAEFFEVDQCGDEGQSDRNGERGSPDLKKLPQINAPHVQMLVAAMADGSWQPSLQRLEAMVDPMELTQLDYAECWLWTHYLASSESGRKLVRQKFDAMQSVLSSKPRWTDSVAAWESEHHKTVGDHLQSLEQVPNAQSSQFSQR